MNEYTDPSSVQFIRCERGLKLIVATLKTPNTCTAKTTLSLNAIT